MKLFRIGSLSVLMFGVIFGFQNCAKPSSAPAASSDSSANSQQISTLKESMQSISQNDVSCEQDSDCTMISLPELPGCAPQGYWITSVHNPDIRNLQNLAAQLAQVESELSTAGVVFACEYLVPPTPACKQNVCSATYPNN